MIQTVNLHKLYTARLSMLIMTIYKSCNLQTMILFGLLYRV